MLLKSEKKAKRRMVIQNLLDAQENMASAEPVDVKGLIKLSKYLLRLLQQSEDVMVQVAAEQK